MTSGFTVVFDATHKNINALPNKAAFQGLPIPVEHAGYSTGSPDIQWTTQDIDNHPGCVLFDQSPNPSLISGDGDDYESGAVLLSELASRAQMRKAQFAKVVRKGQRRPFVYMSQSNIHDVANALVAGGVKDGVGLWVANWSETEASAVVDVLQASGPFPIIGIQFTNAGLYDASVVSTGWLADRAGMPVQPLPTAGVQAGWRWCHKCQGLFYGPHDGASVCPAGGRHAAGVSYDYGLAYSSM